MKNIIKGIIIFLLLPGVVFSIEWIPDRTKTEAETELGWLVAPMPVNVEGTVSYTHLPLPTTPYV